MKTLFLRSLFLYFTLLNPLNSEAKIYNAKLHNLDSSKTIRLALDERGEEIAKLMRGWEEKLSQAGIQSSFYLGAGEFRRMLLHLPLNGPGDLEIMIDFHNHEFKPLNTSSVYKLLKEHGIDPDVEIQNILGHSKKVDIFVRDERTLKEQSPFYGLELNKYFENMGDTSINSLMWGLSSNTIFGSEEHLKSLDQGLIVYTEHEKTKKYEEAVNIPNVVFTQKTKNDGGESKKGKRKNFQSIYANTILRMALRCLRLKADLLVSKNPNGLKLDNESFEKVLKGFELYFEKVKPLSLISNFRLDEIQMELFLKIFKGKSRKKRQELAQMFRTEHPVTVKIWSYLGLDLDIISEAGNFRRPDKIRALEERTVIGNAYFKVLGVLRQEGEQLIRNPFESEQSLLEYHKTVLKSLPICPEEILAHFKASLLFSMKNFDSLNLFEKAKAVNAYNSFIRYLNSKLKTKADKASFFEDFKDRLGHVEVKSYEDFQDKTVLDFFLFAFKNSGQSKSHKESPIKTESFLDSIEEEDKSPVFFVDLDATVFDMQKRILEVLKDFDKEYETRLFSHLRVSDIPNKNFRDVWLKVLVEKEFDSKQSRELDQLITEWVDSRKFWREYLSEDPDFPEMRQFLIEAQNKGIKIVYLSKRYELHRESSLKALKARKLPQGEALILYGSNEHREKDYKVASMRAFLNENPHFYGAAFLDNDRREIAQLSNSDLDVRPILVHHTQNNDGTQKMIFMNDFKEFTGTALPPEQACEFEMASSEAAAA